MLSLIEQDGAIFDGSGSDCQSSPASLLPAHATYAVVGCLVQRIAGNELCAMAIINLFAF